MKSRRTSIRNLAKVLTHDYMAEIIKAEYKYKAQSVLDEIKPIETNTMLESILSLKDNVVFSAFVDWTYEKVTNTSNVEDFIVYGDLHDSMVGTIVVMYLRTINDFTVEDVENELSKTIFSGLREK